MVAPTGSYKVKIHFWDGAYITSYFKDNGDGTYGTTSFDDADTISITKAHTTGSPLANINFDLAGAPTGIIKGKVVDKDTGVFSGDWYSVILRGANEEWGEWRHLNVQIDVSTKEYTVKAPEGTWKVMAESWPNYPESFYTGADSVSSALWSDGATITVVAGQTLEDINFMLAFQVDKSFDYGGTGIISGSVKTAALETVPRASVELRSKDWLVFAETQTDHNGNHSFPKLPDNSYVLSAEPPSGVEAYQKYSKSTEVKVPLTGGETKTQDLTLASANVFGRLLKPDGKPASRVHFWIFEDSDGDGHFDWDSSDPKEYDGETDSNGDFSLTVSETSYGIEFHLPPDYTGVEPLSVYTFSINSSDSAEKDFGTITLSKTSKTITGSVKTADGTAISGAEINAWRIDGQGWANTTSDSSGNYSLDASQGEWEIIVERPWEGKVTWLFTGGPQLVQFAKPISLSSMSTTTGTVTATTSAAHGLKAGDVISISGSTPATYNGTHTVVSAKKTTFTFAIDSRPSSSSTGVITVTESETVDFVVSTAGSSITGKFVMPNGDAISSENIYGVSVEVWNDRGFGNWASLESDGTFSVNVAKGNYEVGFWVDPFYFPTYESPGWSEVRIKKNQVLDLTSSNSPFSDSLIELGDGSKALSFVTKSSTITGTVTDGSGAGMPKIELFAWSRKGGWAETSTDKTGAYTLYVSQGKWEVVAEPGWNSAYSPQPPKRTKVGNNQAATVNFTFATAGHVVSGSVRDSNKALVSSLEAWVYARSYDANNLDDFEVITDAPVESGEFTLKLPDGEYRVGLWISPESDYTMLVDPNTGDVEASVNLTGAESTSTVELIVAGNNSVVSGTFLDANGDAITGLDGDVFAVQGNNWKDTPINPRDGTYELSLTPGNWEIDYYIEVDDDASYLPYPGSSIQATAVADSTVTKDITLSTLDGTITGTVLDPGGTAVSETVYVWVHRDDSQASVERYFDEVETVDGAFSLKLASGYLYDVGVFLPDGFSYFEPKVTQVDLTSSTSATVTLSLVTSDATITGNVTLADTGAAVEEAFVFAWSPDGQSIEVETDSSGDYTLSLSSGSVWNIGADYETDTGTAYKTLKMATVDLTSASSATKNLVMVAKSYTLPESVADTFTASTGYSKVLSDGTEISIPANAIPVSDTSETITINIRPKVSGLSSSSTIQPVSYSYAFELFDSSGKQITQNFTKDVVVTLSYTDQDLIDLGITESEISISFYSDTKKTWEQAKKVSVDTVNNKIFASIDHFSSWGTTGGQGSSSGNSDPTITGSSFTVSEAASVGASVGTATGSDPDGDSLTYSISAGNGSGSFAIGSSTGAITVAGALDYETTQSYTLTVAVVDTASATANADFTVTVTDTNDNTPAFAQATYSSTLNDTVSAGTQLVTATATDADAGSTLIYSITAGNDSSLFAINASSGVVVTAGSLANNSGSHLLTLSASDGTNAGTAVLAITVADLTAPSAPTLTGTASTNDNTPTLSGTAEPNSTVTVYSGVTSLGQTTATGGGSYSFTPATALADGSHSVTATAADGAGNVSAASSVFSLLVDTTAPGTPAISATTPTDDATPTFNGTAEAGSLMTVYSDGSSIGQATVDSGGNYSFTPTSALGDGTYAITTTASDSTGNTSAASASLSLFVDTTVPSAPTLTGTTPTADNTPTLGGVAEANATVTAYSDGTAIGQTKLQ